LVNVDVKLYGALQEFKPEAAGGAPHHPFSFVWVAGETAVDLATRLGIPDGLVAGVAVNETAVDPHTLLQPGDQVAFFPPSVGG
jgi:hypothetical protein